MYSFPYLEPVCYSMSSSDCCFLTCIQISQEASKVIWYSHLFKNIPQFAVIHIVKGFGIVNKAEIDDLELNEIIKYIIMSQTKQWAILEHHFPGSKLCIPGQLTYLSSPPFPHL